MLSLSPTTRASLYITLRRDAREVPALARRRSVLLLHLDAINEPTTLAPTDSIIYATWILQIPLFTNDNPTLEQHPCFFTTPARITEKPIIII